MKLLALLVLFPSLLLAAARESDIRSKLRNTQVLLVPGLLAESYLVGHHYFGMGEYFSPQMELFKRLGIPVQRLPIESEATVDQNAAALAQAIQQSPLPVVIIAHSKGGVDTLTALVEYPEIRSKVRGFISLQAPFYGTPVIDKIQASKRSRKLFQELLDLLGGSEETLGDLSQKVRNFRMNREASELELLGQQVPILSVGSFKTDEPLRFDSILEPIRDLYLRQQKSDGLVPLSSALLAVGEQVVLTEVDHAMPVIPCSHFPYDSAQLTLELLAKIQLK